MIRQIRQMVLLGGLVLACSGPKNPVNLVVSVKDPLLDVAPGPLGSSLDGHFKLTFSLGSYAPDSVVLEQPPSFKLLDANDAAAVDPLSAVAAPGSFPLEIQPGATASVAFDVTSNKLLSTSESSKACAGPVTISGLVTDDAQQQTRFSSTALTVGDCP